MLKEHVLTCNEHKPLADKHSMVFFCFGSAFGENRTGGKIIMFALLSLAKLYLRIS